MAEQDTNQPNDATSTETTADKPEQTVTVEDAGPALKRLNIEIPESRITSKIEESFQHLKSDAQLPGFRRGRARAGSSNVASANRCATMSKQNCSAKPTARRWKTTSFR